MEETDEDGVNIMETNEAEPLDHFKVFLCNTFSTKCLQMPSVGISSGLDT